MSESPEIVTIPAELAAAIVAAQAACDALRRDGKGDKGKYTTADAIAAEAGRVLNDHGAAWVRTAVDFDAPSLGDSDIGNQAYVGDLVQTWMIVHKNGSALMGRSRMPIITSRGRPPDKAAAASLTYDVGQVLRGALCMERENENSIDRRQDDGDATGYRHRKAEESEPLCSGSASPIAAANDKLVDELSERLGKTKATVWRSACKAVGVEAKPPAKLTISAGKLVKVALESKLRDLEAPPARQPGDDDDEYDPTSEGAP